MPQWPSGCNLKEEVIRFHANDGMYNVQWEGIMHRGTHMDAPLHVTELTPDITQYPLWRFFGTGVAIHVPKGKWGKIEPEDLQKFDDVIKEGDIVMVNTDQHHIWADTEDYFAYGCGATGELASGLSRRRSRWSATAARPTTIPWPPSWWTMALAPPSPI